MRKIGKYERIDPKLLAKMQKKQESPLLKSYLLSLLSVVLCCTMFMSTTFAWFTSDVTSAGNEILVGKLEVALGVNADGTDSFANIAANNAPIFDKTIRWEPGHTEYRYFQLMNMGDLAFNYKLYGMIAENTAVTAANTIDPQTLAMQFDVYIKEADAPIPPATELSGFVRVGTLKDILFDGQNIITGSMNADDHAPRYFAMALQMKEDADPASMGNALTGIHIKLVAAQKAAGIVAPEP